MARKRGRLVSPERAIVGAAFVLVGSGAGLAATLATGEGSVRAGGGAVGAAAGLAGAMMTDRAHDRKAARVAALRNRRRVLDEITTMSSSDSSSVFDLLLATQAVAPFRGRRDEMHWLARWCDSPQSHSVAIVSGSAGVGKTRLVRQFALERPKPWVTGWLRPDCGGTALDAMQDCGDPAVILVDDADERQDLKELLESLASHRGYQSLKTILITRTADLSKRAKEKLQLRNRHVMADVPELPVDSEATVGDRDRWFREAVDAYAKKRKMPTPDIPAKIIRELAETDEAENEPMLTLQSQALLAVMGAQPTGSGNSSGRGMPPFEEVAEALFVREQQRWHTSAQSPDWGLANLIPEVQDKAIAALALAGAIGQSQGEVEAALRRVPELDDSSSERLANISRWITYLYPGPAWPVRIRPDMLAEWFIVTQLTHEPRLAPIPQKLTSQQMAALLTLLARASNHLPQAIVLFAEILATDIATLSAAGVAAALSAQEGRPKLDAELARLIGSTDWSVDVVGELDHQIDATVLPRSGAAVAAERVKCARADNNQAPLAEILNELGSRLLILGRYQEALDAAQEAVKLWRPLAEADPAHSIDLARGVDNLRDHLDRLGRYQEALDAAQEAVKLWRPLAEADPAHSIDLARGVDNLRDHLDRLGRYQEALDAAPEAVKLWRPLAEADPAHSIDLARGVDNLRDHLDRLGRYQEALGAALEAVKLWRPLAEADPAHSIDLARAEEFSQNRLVITGNLWSPRAAS
jgi:tetratricopeptide (TPR) repeat protein